MPTVKRTDLQDTIDEQEETIERVSDLVDEALDPELTREEVVSKLKELQQTVSDEEETETEEESQD